MLKSLDERPSLTRASSRRAKPTTTARLQALARNREVARARHAIRGAVRLLWEVCQIPDFRKVMSESHARLLAPLLRSSRRTRASGCRPPGSPGRWRSLDRADGDIDTLMARIAHIRTWTYITHRGDWLEGRRRWQERARGIEDRLSDALHDRITQRFVDRRSAFLVRRLASDGELLASVSRGGEVMVEGAYVGRLDGFRFVPDAIDGDEARMLSPPPTACCAARSPPARGVSPPMPTTPSRSTPTARCAGAAARSGGWLPASGC